MDVYLQSALIYSVLSVVVTLAGGMLATFKPLPSSLTSGVQRFASGAVFAVIAREGQLLTLVATAEALAIALILITSLKRAGMQHGKLLLVVMTLAALIIAGAVAGAKFMWARAGADLDLIFAFCLAALLLRAMESLVESYEDHPSPRGLVIFFAGVVLFLLLGRSLGGAHPAHPGRKVDDQRTSQVESPGERHGTITHAFTRFR